MKSELEPFYIEPLSWKNLRSALNLLNRVFPRESQGGERPYVFFTATLFLPGRLLLKWKGYPFVRYWVARDSETGVAIGTVGLYTKADDDEAYWGGWMCVDPKARGKSLGMALSYRAMVEATKMGDRKYARLYTSTDPNEAAAQLMYEQMGLKFTGRRTNPARAIKGSTGRSSSNPPAEEGARRYLGERMQIG